MLSKEILNQASQAMALIEENTSRTIWRTSMRIHDLIILSKPDWQNNTYLLLRQNFLHLLYNFCFGDSITAIRTPELQQLWEKYEESIFEPILFWDIYLLPSMTLTIPEKAKWVIYPYTPINVRSILKERQMFHFMKQGLNFNEANIVSEKVLPGERDVSVQELIKNGMHIWNIFYKYPHGSNDKKEESLPQIPAYI